MSALVNDLDSTQILPRVYDETTRELRVQATIVPASGPIEVIISHLTDSIKIGDGVDFLAINSDGSINVNSEIDATGGDSIMMVGTEDGTPSGTQHTVKVDNDGTLNTRDVTNIITVPHDYAARTEPSSTADLVTFKQGGSGGVTVATFLVNWETAAKDEWTDYTYTEI